MKLRFFILIFIGLFLYHPSKAQETNSENWVYMGVVYGVYDILKSRSKGEDAIMRKGENVFLYSSFDGEKMVYKIFVPVEDRAYEVVISVNYTGEDIKWSRNDKNIIYMPSLSEMYTHYAGKYHFNVTSAKK